MNTAITRTLEVEPTGKVHQLETAVRVRAKDVRADGVVSVELTSLDGAPLPAWTPGAHVDLMPEGIATRQYSLCGDPADLSSYRLGILLDPNGRGSSLFVHETLQVGDQVVLRGPRNNFPLVESPRYLLIAGGIGITPILPMIRTLARRGDADWRLVYGGRARASMAFLDELLAYGDRVQVAPQDEVGLLDLDTLLATPKDDTVVYCCGPEPLLVAVEEGCSSWPAHSLKLERFNAKPVEEPQRSDSFEVVLDRSGLTLTVPPENSILEVVRGAGVAVLSSCEEGTCGTCETGLLEGEADHRDSLLDEDERLENTCLFICVSRAITPRLVLDL